MEPKPNTSPSLFSLYQGKLHSDLSVGDWEAVYQTSADWLRTEPGQPVPTFIQNIACLFINPPAIIRNKRYLETVNNKSWKAVLAWLAEFQTEADRHNPYFQALDFVTRPTPSKKETIEAALGENPDSAELLFLQSIILRDRKASIEKLNMAVAKKPIFPAAYYLLGIFSLEINQVQEAENYLNQAVDQAPNFLEAHYQLGSLYALYVPDGSEKSRLHFRRVIELDSDGGAGQDARKVLEKNSKPQYGQRIASDRGGRRGGMSIFTILGISLLTAVLFSGPIANLLKINTPIFGILAGLFVFIGLYASSSARK